LTLEIPTKKKQADKHSSASGSEDDSENGDKSSDVSFESAESDLDSDFSHPSPAQPNQNVWQPFHLASAVLDNGSSNTNEVGKKPGDREEKDNEFDTYSEDSEVSYETPDDMDPLKELEEQEKRLSLRGIELENLIRKNLEDGVEDDEELLAEWFDLVNRKNELVIEEDQLRLREEEQKLQELGNSIQRAIQISMGKNQHEKTQQEREEEKWLVKLWIETVEKRNALVVISDQRRKQAFHSHSFWPKEQVLVQFPETGLPTDYSAYEFEIVIKGVSRWKITKNWTQFSRDLRPQVEKSCGTQVKLPPFPERTLLSWISYITPEQEREQLRDYLQSYLYHVITQPNSPLIQTDPRDALLNLVPFLSP